MTNKDIIESVSRFLEGPLNERGLRLYDIEFVKEGPNWYFRVYIDKDEGVLIEDCEFISREVDKFLDEKDPIPQGYMLEVSSPGLDRPLKNEADFLRYIGHLVDIKLYKSKDKRKRFQGELNGFENDVITITEANGSEWQFLKAEVASCRLAVIV